MATGDVLNILIIAIISFLSSYSSKQTALNVFDNPNIYIYIYIFKWLHILAYNNSQNQSDMFHIFFPEGI